MTITLPEGWRAWEPAEKRALLARVEAEIVALRDRRWQPYPWQRLHDHQGAPPGSCGPDCQALPAPPLRAQQTWLLMGGRGIGKTDGGAHYVLDHINGPPCDRKVRGGHRVAIVAPTLGDAAESCVRGPSGLQAYDPRVRLYGSAGGTYVRFHNGAEGKLFGAHTPNDVDRLRAGGNRCLVWLEEAAAMRHLGPVLEHARLGLRIGPAPHFVASTTPKARPEVRDLVEDPDTVITRGTTDQAHHLAQAVRDKLYAKYQGTRTGRQELGGELLTDVEGALWQLWLIDRGRWLGAPDAIPQLGRVVVAVDPPGGATECGIVVAGRTRESYPDATGRPQRHLYVLADLSDHYRNPGEWAAAACRAYHQYGADAVVGEQNYGGEMVEHTIRVQDPTVRYRSVNATRGKARRGEPVVALYEQDRAHHVGSFPRLEDEQTTWTEDADWSPNRMDGLVWAATDLLLNPKRGGRVTAA